MSYQIASKAYKVGEPEAVARFKDYGFNRPEDLIGLAYADTPGKAKYKFREVDYHSFTSLRCVRSPKDDLFHFEGKKKSLEEIERITKHRDWRNRLSRMAAELPDMEVYIFSGQWGAYWGPNSAGYTSKKSNAGIYTTKEAWDNVSHCGPEKHIEFRPVALGDSN